MVAPTPEEALTLAAMLAEKIKARRPQVAENVAYYKGAEGRMRFASEEFRDYFERRFSGFSDNWCMPVAQAPIERMHYLGMRLDGETSADPEVAHRWERNDGDRGLGEALLMMTVARRSFALVSPSPAGARITFENPDSAAVLYDGQTRARRAGLALWQDDTREYASLYLPNTALSLKREKRDLSHGERYTPPGVEGWEFHERNGDVETPHPFGVVPLVEFRNQALLDDDPISDIAGVKAMQDSINLVWAYLLNALDFASLPARVVMNVDVPKEPILDKDGQKIGERPVELDRLIRERITFVPGQAGKTASIGEWSAANLSAFSEVIEHAVEHIAAQTRTPAHYLIASSSNTPATGYELAEAGLVSKSAERISYATSTVREINRLAAIADNEREQAARIATGKALWRKPQYRSEQQLMDGLLKMRQAGFPFRWVAEEYGLTPAEVDRVMGMIEQEQADPYLTQMAAKDAAAVAPVVG